ncbi:TetR/AcrR family transcriptional regulator [Leptolyngbya sp. AN03gr2]|uniref:TetR/AcrR family transcriptional regulator n=1 Tax=unclassified Leptolyngbya TaxID=2650499 RepID=UPI003D31B8C6
MPKTRTDARERILAIADQLFYQEGIRAIGVDTIIAKSEVAKTTLYRYFPSKDDLVVAYLENRNAQFWALFETVVQRSTNPEQKLSDIFGWLDELLASETNYGCPFLMVASEFPEPDYPGHQVAIAHKTKMRDRFTELAKAQGIQQAEELSTGLMLLVDGAFVQRRLYRSHQVNLQQAATILLQAYEPRNIAEA